MIPNTSVRRSGLFTSRRNSLFASSEYTFRKAYLIFTVRIMMCFLSPGMFVVCVAAATAANKIHSVPKQICDVAVASATFGNRIPGTTPAIATPTKAHASSTGKMCFAAEAVATRTTQIAFGTKQISCQSEAPASLSSPIRFAAQAGATPANQI